VIRPLRRAHLALWVVLSVLLAAGIFAGLAARRPVAVMHEIPAELVPTSPVP